MASISSLVIFLAVIFLLTLKITATTETAQKETQLHFYVQEKLTSPNATTIKVASNPIDQSNQFYTFGNIFVFDDPITEGPAPTSRLLGRAQGTLAITSFDGYDGLFTFNCVFTDYQPWTNSSLTIIGRTAIRKPINVFSVVGGNGQFRLARGYVEAKLLSTNPQDGIFTFETKVIISSN